MINPAIIIPAAGLGKRMKSYGPKALVKCAHQEPLICRQIRLLRERFEDPYIVVVLGFGAERIKKFLPRDVHVVFNPDFAITNVAHSIKLGMVCCPPWLPLLIIYGDLVFNKEVLRTISLEQSSILLDIRDGRESEVGLTVVDNQATFFSYGLPLKWAQIATLLYPEQDIFNRLMCDNHRRKHFGYEVFNEMLEQDAKLEVLSNDKMRLVEVDSSKDIANARRIL